MNNNETSVTVINYMYMVLLMTLVLGCQQHPDSDIITDLSFIQLKNAVAEKNFHWVKTKFEIESIKSENLFKANLMFAESWLNGEGQRINEAMKYLFIAEKMSPNDRSTKHSIIKILNRIGEWESLEERLLDEAINPFLKAQIYLNINPAKVIKQLKSIPENKQNLLYHELMTSYYHEQNNKDLILKHVNSAMTRGSMNPEMYHIGYQIYLRIKQNDQAIIYQNIYRNLKNLKSLGIKSNEKLISIESLLNSNSGFAYNDEFNVLYLKILLANGKLNDAKEMLERINHKSLSSSLSRDLFSALVNSSNFEVANQIIKKDSSESTDERINYYFCLIKSQVDELHRAIEFCQSALQVNPWSAQTLHQIAILMFKTNQIITAKSNLKTAVSYAPWHDDWRILLAQALLNEGEIDEAISILDESINTESPIIFQFKKDNGLMPL